MLLKFRLRFGCAVFVRCPRTKEDEDRSLCPKLPLLPGYISKLPSFSGIRATNSCTTRLFSSFSRLIVSKDVLISSSSSSSSSPSSGFVILKLNSNDGSDADDLRSCRDEWEFDEITDALEKFLMREALLDFFVGDGSFPFASSSGDVGCIAVYDEFRLEGGS